MIKIRDGFGRWMPMWCFPAKSDGTESRVWRMVLIVSTGWRPGSELLSAQAHATSRLPLP